jgi:hypothetical protein
MPPLASGISIAENCRRPRWSVSSTNSGTLVDIAEKRKTRGPHSSKTVRNIASVLHSALDAAVRWKLNSVNSLDACQLPKLQKAEAKALDRDQTA